MAFKVKDHVKYVKKWYSVYSNVQLAKQLGTSVAEVRDIIEREKLDRSKGITTVDDKGHVVAIATFNVVNPSTGGLFDRKTDNKKKSLDEIENDLNYNQNQNQQ